MNHPYLPVLVFFVVALAVPIGALVLARVWMALFTPIKKGKTKNALYECGVEPLAGRQGRFHSQYYMFGLLFLIFDVEAVFLFPFAVAFIEFDKVPGGTAAYWVSMVFLLLLAESLLWAWTRGLMNWRAPANPKLKTYGD